jgi:hypothetical protein
VYSWRDKHGGTIVENVLRWDCICDACDREGRYHSVGRGPTPPREKPPGWGWIIIAVIVALATVFYIVTR